MKLYIVTMYRWGDREKHSYVLGGFSTADKAKDAAIDELIWRGSKYLPEILEFDLDIPDYCRAVMPLKDLREFEANER